MDDHAEVVITDEEVRKIEERVAALQRRIAYRKMGIKEAPTGSRNMLERWLKS